MFLPPHSNFFKANGLFTSARTLSVHMYIISGEGLYVKETYATAVILLMLVMIINAISSFTMLISKRMENKK